MVQINKTYRSFQPCLQHKERFGILVCCLWTWYQKYTLEPFTRLLYLIRTVFHSCLCWSEVVLWFKKKKKFSPLKKKQITIHFHSLLIFFFPVGESHAEQNTITFPKIIFGILNSLLMSSLVHLSLFIRLQMSRSPMINVNLHIFRSI